VGIIAWVVLGALAGGIASALMGDREGCLLSIVVGIVGAFVGGFLFSLIGKAPVTGLNLWSLFVALVGSMVCIVILRALRRR